MAQLKSTVISGSLRVTDSTYTSTLQTQILHAPTASNSTTYGAGTDGHVLKTNGTSIYWGSPPATGVTSVQVQASSPLSSSVSTAQTSTLNTTISFAAQVHNTVLAGPAGTSAANAVPTFRALTADDIPTLSITSKTNGTLTVARGGTNLTSITQGGVIYAASSTAYGSTGAGTSGYLLQSGGTSAPSWIQATDQNVASTIVKRSSGGGALFSGITITGGYYPSIILQPTHTNTKGKGTIESGYSGTIGLHCYDTTATGDTRRVLEIRNKSKQSNSNNALVYREVIDGTWETDRIILHSGNLINYIQDYIKAYEVTVTWPNSNMVYLCDEDEFLTTDTLIVGPGSTTSTTIHDIVLNASFDFELTTQTNGKTRLAALVCKTSPPEGTVINFVIVRLRGLK